MEQITTDASCWIIAIFDVMKKLLPLIFCLISISCYSQTIHQMNRAAPLHKKDSISIYQGRKTSTSGTHTFAVQVDTVAKLFLDSCGFQSSSLTYQHVPFGSQTNSFASSNNFLFDTTSPHRLIIGTTTLLYFLQSGGLILNANDLSGDSDHLYFVSDSSGGTLNFPLPSKNGTAGQILTWGAGTNTYWSAGTENLQRVTDNGATTTNPISINGAVNFSQFVGLKVSNNSSIAGGIAQIMITDTCSGAECGTAFYSANGMSSNITYSVSSSSSIGLNANGGTTNNSIAINDSIYTNNLNLSGTGTGIIGVSSTGAMYRTTGGGGSACYTPPATQILYGNAEGTCDTSDAGFTKDPLGGTISIVGSGNGGISHLLRLKSTQVIPTSPAGGILFDQTASGNHNWWAVPNYDGNGTFTISDSVTNNGVTFYNTGTVQLPALNTGSENIVGSDAGGKLNNITTGNGLMLRNDSLIATGDSWSLTGNAGTDPTVNFIGTTDDEPLVLMLNNSWYGQLNSDSNIVAIGNGAALANTGTKVVAIGFNAASNNTGVTNIIGIGAGASQNNTGTNVVGVGASAAKNNTGSNAVGIGNGALTGNSHTSVVGLGTGVNAGSDSELVVSNTLTHLRARFNGGNAGDVLTQDINHVATWQPASGGSGTVTSIATTAPITGGTITTTGTIGFDTTNHHTYQFYKGKFYPLTGNPSNFLTANQTITLSGDVTGNGTTAITTAIKSSVALVGSPTTTTQTPLTNNTTISTTAYTDAAVAAAIQGVNPATAVQAATTTVLPAVTCANGVSGIGATLTQNSAAILIIDGYTPVLNDRLLIKNQATASQNGIYNITTLGTSLIPFVLTRASDFNQVSDINSTGAIPVINGTVNGTTQWVVSSTISSVACSGAGTSITFTQFSANPANNITTSTSAGGDLTGTYPNPTIKASVGLTGTPTVPTAATSTNTTQAASTAFVQNNLIYGDNVTVLGQYSNAKTGTFALLNVFSSSTPYKYNFAWLNIASAAQNDALTYKVSLPAGTYNISVFGITNSNRGILTVKIDGTSVGTIDEYTASNTFNQLLTLTGVSVAAGDHTIQFIAATKNASSSGFIISVDEVNIQRQ